MLTEPLESPPADGPARPAWSAPLIRQRYEQIADHLVEEIRTGRLRPGDRLPGERELAQQLGVGRASVREALGFLQVRAIVETRRGAGSFVAPGAVAAVTDAGPGSGLVLPPDAGPSALIEARLILEPQIARLAATAGGAPDDMDELLERMAAACDAADAGQRRIWSDADREFHRRIAAATRNPVGGPPAPHLSDLMDQPLWRRLRDDAISAPGTTVLQLAEHRLIAAAITEHDPDAAEEHARRHITRTRRYMALD